MNPMSADVALLVLRLVIGGLLAAHGARKLVGWFGGFGLRATGGYLAGLGFRPGVLFATLAGLAEAAGGLLLMLGLFTPLAGALLIGVLVVVAVAGHGSHGLWNHEGGYEYPLVLAVVAGAIGVAGPGAYALDSLLPAPIAGFGSGLIAAAAGVAGGLITLLTRRRQAAAPAAMA